MPEATPPSEPPIIVVTDLHKWFGAQHVLRGVSLEVARGETVVVCGPSGSGKSTFIRCLNHLEEHDRGTIMVDGITLDRDVRHLQAVRREVGMVFQQFNLFPHLTVLENLTLAPVRVRKTKPVAAERQALALLDRVQLADHAAKYPAQLSGGQQQRVAIARSLCMLPKIMLFDEPTSALDPEMIQEVLDVMTELAREGLTMVVVTHEMGFARAVAHRVAFMDQGELVEVAPPAQFFGAPQSERAREFLGHLLRADGGGRGGA
ncbi:MAG: amino acid ABC transporter ATP-binding protein [Deltaproteobacteria bacterium]|nr:amino acid ABC transporter ATP-binding protein [Deltaproteobacteria bacterium]